MTTVKVHSFVGKFLALWAEGENITLTLSAKNGKAKINMELEVGEIDDSKNDFTYSSDAEKHHSSVFGNTRQRRREGDSKQEIILKL